MEKGLKEEGFKYYRDYTPPRWMKETEYGMLCIVFCNGELWISKHFRDGSDVEKILKEKI